MSSAAHIDRTHPPGAGPHRAARPGASGIGGFVRGIAREAIEIDLTGQAAKVAFYASVSLPPALLTLFALTGIFGGELGAARLAGWLDAMLAERAAPLIEAFVAQLVQGSGPAPLSIGALVALWAATNVFAALARALNRVYAVDDRASWLRRRAVALGVLLATLGLFTGGSAALLVGPEVVRALRLTLYFDVLWPLLQWAVAMLLVVGALWIVYYALPNRDQSRDRGALLQGALCAAALWAAATSAFRFYLAHVASYGETYGLLGAVLVLLLWLYLTALVTLLGGMIAARLQWA